MAISRNDNGMASTLHVSRSHETPTANSNRLVSCCLRQHPNQLGNLRDEGISGSWIKLMRATLVWKIRAVSNYVCFKGGSSYHKKDKDLYTVYIYICVYIYIYWTQHQFCWVISPVLRWKKKIQKPSACAAQKWFEGRLFSTLNSCKLVQLGKILTEDLLCI